MNTTYLQLGNIVIDEPTTTGTDLLLTIICIFIFTWLSRLRGQCGSVSPWRNFFLLMGLSSLLGSIVHGLRNYQSEEYHYNFWMTMNIICGVAVYFAQVATIQSNFRISRFRKILVSIPNIQLAAYLVILYFIHNFNVVVIQIAVGMVPIMFINFFDYFRGTQGGGWISAGIALSCLPALVRGLKFSLNAWFNYNDLSHVLLMCSFISIFYGVSKMVRARRQVS
ncbi:MAG TPA: hypothetical protein VI112_07615 [Bacteroidia bacterium]|jgi:hypothetical protein